jgi:death-on-curing protein
LVESAIARPYSGYYRGIARKAAALVESVATNHGFADGNKRTAVILTHLLLRKSGYELVPLGTDASLDIEVETIVLSVVNRDVSFEDLVGWFRARIRRSEHPLRGRFTPGARGW